MVLHRSWTIHGNPDGFATRPQGKRNLKLDANGFICRCQLICLVDGGLKWSWIDLWKFIGIAWDTLLFFVAMKQTCFGWMSILLQSQKKNTCLKSWSLLSSIVGFGEYFVPSSGFTYHESERRFKSHEADGFPVSQSEPSHYGFKMWSGMVCGWKLSRSPAQNWPQLQLSTTTLWA